MVDIPPPSGHFVMFLPHLPGIVSWLGLTWVVLGAWLPMCLVGVLWHAPFPWQFSIDLIRQLWLLSPHYSHLYLSGSDDRNQSTKVLGLLFLLRDQTLCKRPSIFLPRLQLAMIINQFYRISTPVSLLRSPSEQAKATIAALITWACPSSLLSLRIVNLYTQTHDTTSFCVCWHLISSQFGWDEVKGLCPLVYEDTLSETSHCDFLLLDLLVVMLPLDLTFISTYLGCPTKAVDFLFADMLATNWLSTLGRFLGNLTSFACCIITGFLPPYRMKQALQMQVHHGALGLTALMLGFIFLSMSRVYFALYWNSLIDLCYWLSLLSPIVQWILDSLSYLFHNCKLWIVWLVVLCDCVLGLCPKALAQHQRMLSLAQRGFESNRRIIPHAIIQAPALFKPGLLTRLKRLPLPNISFLDPFVTL